METWKISVILCLVALDSMNSAASRKSLQVVRTYATIQENAISIKAVYDGSTEGIYILAQTSTETTDLYFYDLITNEVDFAHSYTDLQKIGEVVTDTNGIIFFTYFHKAGLHVLNQTTNEVEFIREFSEESLHIFKPSSSSNIIYSIGHENLQCFNLEALNNCGNYDMLDINGFKAFFYKKYGFVFSLFGDVELINLETNHSRVQNANFPDSLNIVHIDMVDDGRYGYFIGGLVNNTDGLIRFDPESLKWEIFQIKTFTGDELLFPLQPMAIVYVEKFDSIYILGREHGVVGGFRDYQLDILYIDLANSRNLRFRDQTSDFNQTVNGSDLLQNGNEEMSDCSTLKLIFQTVGNWVRWVL